MDAFQTIQSWWEVPAVAHFCYVFRSAFKLFFIEIAELEAAILDVQDPEMCISLEQLIQRLLQGCFADDTVTTENWEDKLHDLFDENCDEDENPFPERLEFSHLNPREKVDVLFKLCEFRLDAKGALEAIKDIPSEEMQAKCLGKDSQNNLYWYFYDERLYKETPLPTDDSGKNDTSLSKKNKGIKGTTVKNGKKISAKGGKANSSVNTNQTWSIVCYSSSDWESLAKRFSKRKNSDEKELANKIRSDYLQMLEKVVSEKEQFLRKRFIELAPKRTSSRISKVQEQKKLEEMKAAKEAEKARILREELLAKKEEERKKQEIEERRKRAEERHKAIEGRAMRAQLRQESRFDESDEETIPRNSKVKIQARNGQHSIQRTKSKSSNDECSDRSFAESDSDSDEEDNDSVESDSGASGNSSDNSNSESESDSQSLSKNAQFVNGRNSAVKRKVDVAQSNKQNTSQNSYNFYKWNSNMVPKGNKLHILNSSHNELSQRKKLRTDESKDFKNGALNDIKSALYREKPIFQPFRQRNFITYSRVPVTPSPSVIRLDFIKPSPKQVSS